MALSDRLTLTMGSDRSPVIRLKNKKTKDPIDLTNVTSILVEFTNRDRTTLTLANVLIPATKAQALKGTLTFTAEDGGALGNSILLNFNGTDTVQTIVDAWNTANPTNRVEHNSPTGLEIIPSSIVKLTGGYNAYRPVEVYGDPKLGKILIRLLEKETSNLRPGANQTLVVILDNGANPGGTRTVGFYENKLDVIGR